MRLALKKLFGGLALLIGGAKRCSPSPKIYEGMSIQDQFVDAAFSGDIPRLEELLSAGANLDADGRNWNALHAAVENMDESAVRFLLTAGADPNRTCWGSTPLHHAIDIEIDSVNQRLQRTLLPEELPDPTITRILLEHGADSSICDPKGETPYPKNANRNPIF